MADAARSGSGNACRRRKLREGLEFQPLPFCAGDRSSSSVEHEMMTESPNRVGETCSCPYGKTWKSVWRCVIITPSMSGQKRRTGIFRYEAEEKLSTDICTDYSGRLFSGHSGRSASFDASDCQHGGKGNAISGLSVYIHIGNLCDRTCRL